MEPIYPLTEEHLNQFRGQLVCVVMQDGTRHVGILSRCRGGRLVLNEDAGGEHGDVAGHEPEAEGSRRPRKRSGSRKSGKKADAERRETAGAAGFGSFGCAGPPAPYAGPWEYAPPYGPYGYFGPRQLLDLALIAAVLLIL